MRMGLEMQPVGREERGDGRFDSWGRLLARAQAGDSVAYADLLAGLAPWLRVLATRRLGSREDAEDAVQDILVSVDAIRHTYDPRRPFGPWITTIARRRIIDAIRRRGRRQVHEIDMDPGEAPEPVDRMDPSVIAARVVDINEVRRAVRGLPPRQREAVELLRLQEMSLKEAAAFSGQTEGALKVAVHRALKLLGTLLGKADPS